MLTDTHRYNSEDSFGSSVPQQDVNKGDDLQGFAEAHAVSQNTTETTAVLIALERLHQIIIQETNTADLKKNVFLACCYVVARLLWMMLTITT